MTERAELPWLTLSYSDAITDRGFHYVFQTSPTANTQAEQTVPFLMKLAESATGKRPKSVAIIGDNTAASVSFLKPIKDHILAQEHLTEVLEQIYTPPLSDATTLVQPVRAAKPDFVMLLSTNDGDDKLLIDTFIAIRHAGDQAAAGRQWRALGRAGAAQDHRYGHPPGRPDRARQLARQGPSPICPRATSSAPAIRGSATTRSSPTRMSRYSPGRSTRRASPIARKVADAIRTMDITDGPAIYFPGSHLKFDQKGRRVDAQLVIVQWQNGKPVTIFPQDMAAAKPVWPT